MTPKSLQQAAREYAVINYERNMGTEELRDAYTAGATDERRELGNIILELVEIAESEHSYGSMGVELVTTRNKHAELIATLREELK
jgi:hypothetical protein